MHSKMLIKHWMQHATRLKQVLLIIAQQWIFFIWVYFWLVYEEFLHEKKYFLGNIENRAHKEKLCCVAESFCSFSILVSPITKAVHNEKQNAGIRNRNPLCFLIAWIVPGFSSLSWGKGDGRQKSFLHIACMTEDGNCIMPAVLLGN